MTQERIMEIMREGGNLRYEVGKEAAAESIKDHDVHFFRNFPHLSSIFGSDWVRGFFDYLNAWETINGKAQ